MKTYEQMTEEFCNAFKDYKLREEYAWTESGKKNKDGKVKEYFGWKKDENTFVFVYLNENGDIQVDSCFDDGDVDTYITPYKTESQFDCVKTFINTLIFLFITCN